MAPEKPPGVVQYRKFSQDDLPEEAPPSRSELLIEEPVFEEPQRKRVGENVW
ncbi:predicted protein [Uncinocarpus reesii 1704]|uniref:Uncharacterized protein n=1 Tax=Uncinocarpus reesii (strain UAMH 1704) TaxID=336963 RepID=C4JWL7_UNCRE|nr:uncharacterized protein UREG_06959 [Uncinocarpus reesii 1704]EEP82094.1 predicted protein [Uncinocarpus reesii 1704]